MKIRNFSRLTSRINVPNLIEIQKKSYDDFLQLDVKPEERKNYGLQAVFAKVFPIINLNETLALEFVKYSFGQPKYTEKECQERGMTYGVPLKMTVRLIVSEEGQSGQKKVQEVKDQEIFVCELPLMTTRGTFVINGAERVIVNQLHRSPGIIFEEDEERTKTLGKKFLTARLIPYRGSWLEFEFDNNYVLYARIDRKRKIVATAILRGLGFSSNEDILKLFYKTEKINVQNEDKKKIIGKVLAKDVMKKGTSEVLVKSNLLINEAIYKQIDEEGEKTIEITVIPSEESVILSIHHTLMKDHTTSKDEGILEVYKKLRPGQPTTIENARTFFNNLFFNFKKYDLGRVGRYKINKRLSQDAPEKRVLTKEDIIDTIKELINLVNISAEKDDIDHLGNRRVRCAGELVENQFYVGMVRMERVIREKMSIVDPINLMPNTLINTKPIIAVIREFFGSSQLSQFMDQINPLAELTHKRRLSALGPGGLDRERAGFEVRDVHYTHYGRMCPIETPEGPNIGLIASLSIYAKVNNMGFIETPYRKVKNGVVTGEIEYLTADDDDKYIIAQANAELDDNGKFKDSLISSRYKADFPLVHPSKIDYMDVSPMQLVSVATALIPFLEHNDANRALMGSNMQRQAVPLMITESPIIATGIERNVAEDSGVLVIAKRPGTIEYIDSEKIVIVTDEGEIDTYNLIKYARSNQDTCMNQKPIIKKGIKVSKGTVLADGSCTDKGELALGHNVLAAFMPWRGYNFEDAIIISERMLKEDKFSSVHIEEFQLDARDTKLGREEITKDIPNVSEEALKDLDERGIIKVGSEVRPEDILIGKIAPKGETELTPEEKFLRAIFGEKAKDVRDASLRAPSGIEGIVIGVKIFERKEKESKSKESEKKKKIEKDAKKSIEMVSKELTEELSKAKKAAENKLEAAKNAEERKQIEAALQKEIAWLKEKTKSKKAEIEQEKIKAFERIEKGDELPPGVIKLVKVYIAKKRKIAVGDKMAGRHGNKGVIAKIMPEESMPFLPNGEPVDIVLNPLGVPSRMNVGQIFEAHLGWAAKTLGFRAICPVFDGAKENEIKGLLKEANLPQDGKITLYDGHSGDPFEQPVTVGHVYMMKLLHLVDDKMHARSIGPYSLVTQQPLGGKAQFGGQRFGEMEVWALEAYGAAYTLQEILTVKSDDVEGRTKVYEALVKGKNTPEPGLPESFNVLVKELESLGLSIELLSPKEALRLHSEEKK